MSNPFKLSNEIENLLCKQPKDGKPFCTRDLLTPEFVQSSTNERPKQNVPTFLEEHDQDEIESFNTEFKLPNFSNDTSDFSF